MSDVLSRPLYALATNWASKIQQMHQSWLWPGADKRMPYTHAMPDGAYWLGGWLYEGEEACCAVYLSQGTFYAAWEQCDPGAMLSAFWDEKTFEKLYTWLRTQPQGLPICTTSSSGALWLAERPLHPTLSRVYLAYRQACERLQSPLSLQYWMQKSPQSPWGVYAPSLSAQQYAILHAWLHTPRRLECLQASAGTGKTRLLALYLRHRWLEALLQQKNLHIDACAVAHEAVAVIMRAFCDAGPCDRSWVEALVEAEDLPSCPAPQDPIALHREAELWLGHRLAHLGQAQTLIQQQIQAWLGYLPHMQEVQEQEVLWQGLMRLGHLCCQIRHHLEKPYPRIRFCTMARLVLEKKPACEETLLLVDEASQCPMAYVGVWLDQYQQCLVAGDPAQCRPVGDSGEEEGSSVMDTLHDWPKAILHENYRNPPLLIDLWNHLHPEHPLIAMCQEPDHGLPVWGYHHHSYPSKKCVRSRMNLYEAKWIMHWLWQHHSVLQRIYDQPLSSVLAIMTPFEAQAQQIRVLLQAVGMGDILVGTVHALQGQQRPVILFSQVYAGKDAGYLLTQEKHMLSVVISRAQHHLFYVGDIDWLARRPDLQGATLASWMRRLAQSYEATPLQEMQQDQLHLLVTHQDHHQALTRACQGAHHDLVICSPFLSLRAVQNHQALAALLEAQRRGVRIVVMTDPEKHTQAMQSHAAMRFLEDHGIVCLLKTRLHSKALWVDTQLLILGSYNWLSAEQHRSSWQQIESSLLVEGPFARHFIAQQKQMLDPSHPVERAS